MLLFILSDGGGGNETEVHTEHVIWFCTGWTRDITGHLSSAGVFVSEL